MWCHSIHISETKGAKQSLANTQTQLFETNFDTLVGEIQGCRKCSRMSGCTRVISWANGNVQAPLMFIGEAPGRLGADRTAIPFHGDKAGDNFEALLNNANISRSDIFVTNAVLCNPRDEKGNNSPPNKSEIENCVENLKKQISLVQPAMVMTLGAVALSATNMIENHSLSLRESVRTKKRWFGRWLLPLYHPGARAMIHRSFANQTSDYYHIAETFKRLAKGPSKRRFVEQGKLGSWDLVAYVLERLGQCSLFRLHKTLYLIDLECRSQLSRPATSFFYIRQKDGPYCVELGGGWHRRFSDKLTFVKGKKPSLQWQADGLFEQASENIDPTIRKIADDVIARISSIPDTSLKIRAYLSTPMRQFLKLEKAGHSMLNRPLFS